MSGALQAVFQNARSFGPPSFIANIYQSTTARCFGNGSSATSSRLVVGGSVSSTVNGPQIIYLASQDASGVIQWQKTGSVNYCYLQYLTTSSSGDIYTLSNVQSTSTGYAELGFSRFNSSGTLLANKNLGSNSADAESTGVGVDSSGNSYITCRLAFSPVRIGIMKLDSSGTVVWQKSFESSPSSEMVPKNSFTNSSGTTFIAGTVFYSSYYAFVSVVNSSGTAVYTKLMYNNTGATAFYGQCAIEDSSGNFYLVSNHVRSDNFQLETMLSKWNSSGTYQWTTSVSGLGGNTNDRVCMALDSSGNIYYGTSGGELFKYNSSGTLQWQRKFANSFDIQLKSISVTGSNIFVSGHALYTGNAYYYAFEASVPTDGSKTGTYSLNSQTYTYSVTSYTTRTPSFAQATTWSVLSGFPGLAALTPSNTYSDSSLTAVTVTL